MKMIILVLGVVILSGHFAFASDEKARQDGYEASRSRTYQDGIKDGQNDKCAKEFKWINMENPKGDPVEFEIGLSVGRQSNPSYHSGYYVGYFGHSDCKEFPSKNEKWGERDGAVKAKASHLTCILGTEDGVKRACDEMHGVEPLKIASSINDSRYDKGNIIYWQGYKKAYLRVAVMSPEYRQCYLDAARSGTLGEIPESDCARFGYAPKSTDAPEAQASDESGIQSVP